MTDQDERIEALARRTAREVALALFCALHDEGGYSDVVLDEEIEMKVGSPIIARAIRTALAEPGQCCNDD